MQYFLDKMSVQAQTDAIQSISDESHAQFFFHSVFQQYFLSFSSVCSPNIMSHPFSSLFHCITITIFCNTYGVKMSLTCACLRQEHCFFPCLSHYLKSAPPQSDKKCNSDKQMCLNEVFLLHLSHITYRLIISTLNVN